MLGDHEKLESLECVVEMKRVFFSHHVQLGTAAECAEIGDAIAIIRGSRVPCVLRRAKGQNCAYQVTSQYYLDGWCMEDPPNDLQHPHRRRWEEEPDEIVLV